MVKLIIFDLDGVLVDAKEIHYESLNKALRQIDEKFDSKNVMSRAELFKNIPVDYWFGASTFFLLMSTTYIKDMENSTRAKMIVKKIIMRGMEKLPKFLIPKRLHDFILN